MTEKQAYDLKKWEGLIRDCQQSGMKIKDWCERNGITKDQYYYWLHRVRKLCFNKEIAALSGPVAAATPDQPAFVEITPAAFPSPESVQDAYGNSPSATIRMDGFSIDIMPDASVPFLRRIMEAARYAQA